MKHACWVVLLSLVATNVAWAGIVTDDFEDGTLAPFWEAVGDGEHTLVESGGRLNINAWGDGAWGGVASRFELSGDFDVSVDFEDFNPGNAGDQAAFLSVLGTEGSAVAAIDVAGQSPFYKYVFAHGFSGVSVSTSDSSGALRIARQGSAVSGYYRDGGSWVMLGTSDVGWTESASVELVAGYDYASSLGLTA